MTNGHPQASLQREPTPPPRADLLAAMVRARVIDRELAALHERGRIPFHVHAPGGEAVLAGCIGALHPKDWLMPTLRDSPAALLRGASLRSFAAQPVGYADQDLHIVPALNPNGAHLIHAAGVGWAMRLRRTEQAVLAFLGESIARSESFKTALCLAAHRQSNAVFACRLPATSPARPAAEAALHAVSAAEVDGSDATAVHQATREALARARAGGGPTLLELRTKGDPLAGYPIDQVNRLDRSFTAELQAALRQ